MTSEFLECVQRSLQGISQESIDMVANYLVKAYMCEGRVFVIGNGGGAAHASHACCDFRKLCAIDARCPSDNAAELTARVNDEGWETVYSNWLRCSAVDVYDVLVVVSVGGGSREPSVSPNIVNAIECAQDAEANVIAIVGRDGGYAGKHADHCILIPCDRPDWVTPVTEGVQSVILHALACHPLLQVSKAKWEGLEA